MAEALVQVKREFGRDAVILNTRTGTKGGFLGFWGKSYVEITAVRQPADLPAPSREPWRARTSLESALTPMSTTSSAIVVIAAISSLN